MASTRRKFIMIWCRRQASFRLYKVRRGRHSLDISSATAPHTIRTRLTEPSLERYGLRCLREIHCLEKVARSSGRMC